MNDQENYLDVPDEEVTRLHDELYRELSLEFSMPTGSFVSNPNGISNTNSVASPTGTLNSSNGELMPDINKVNFNDMVNDYIDKHPKTSNLPVAAKRLLTIALTTSLSTLAKRAKNTFIDVQKGVDDPVGPTIKVPDGMNVAGGNKGLIHSYLEYSATPIEVRLDTGIIPNTYSPIYHNSVKSYYYPLHLSYCNFGFPLTSTDISTYLNSIIAFIFTNAVQQAVSYSINTSLVDSSSLGPMMNALMQALQVYYFYDSILMYSNDPLNRNEAMLNLRTNISSTDINNLLNLRRVLAGIPIPPNMFNLMYYLMQNYQSSSIPGSALLKFCPIPNSTATGYPNAGYITTSINALLSYESNFALLSRACPKWIMGDLPGSSIIPIHDPNFNTIWQNAPVWYKRVTSGTISYNVQGPSVSSKTDVINYTTSTNTLDGAAFALGAVYDTSSSLWRPSMISPIQNYVSYTDASNNIISNRLSFGYYGSMSSPTLVDSYQDANLCAARDETYFLNYNYGTTLLSSVPFGNAQCLAVSANTISDTCTELVDWLMSFNTMGVVKDDKLYPSKSSNRKGKPKQNSNKKSKNKVKGKSKD